MDYLDTDVTNPFFWGFMSEAEEIEDRDSTEKEKETENNPSPNESEGFPYGITF